MVAQLSQIYLLHSDRVVGNWKNNTVYIYVIIWITYKLPYVFKKICGFKKSRLFEGVLDTVYFTKGGCIFIIAPAMLQMWSQRSIMLIGKV